MSQDNPYLSRINLVLNTIATCPDDDLSLARLADLAGFSPFHFHRIFKTIVGETLNQFVWRTRIERAVSLLRANPHLTLSDAAFTCGFTTLAGFSRAFKKHFDMPPSQWNRASSPRNRNLDQIKGEYPAYTVNTLQPLTNRIAIGNIA